MKRIIFTIIIVLYSFIFITPSLLPRPDMSNFVSASATLSNSKFSSEDGSSVQSGAITILLTTVNEIPSDGNILIEVPAVQTVDKSCDGLPDNGFDFKNVNSSAISVTGCTDGNWNTQETVSCGTGSTNHTLLINRQTSSCAAGSTITVVIQNVINPAPISSTRIVGNADIYDINIKSRNNANNPIDKIDVKVAPVEGVKISAQVDETLSFAVVGVNSDSGKYCGITRDVNSPNTTSTSVSWGTISSIYEKDTHNTTQKLIVSTNASSGYKVFIEENDQIGRDKNICKGEVPSTGEFMFGNNVCIRNTLCNDKRCSHTNSSDWTDMKSYVGFGYSLENENGTDAKFLFNELGREFSTKILADREAEESQFDNNSEIMTNGGPVENSAIYVCYRISIPENQPAGNYYNKIKYTILPTF